MNDKQKQACVDYINEHAAELHGVEPKDLNIGDKITVDDVLAAVVRGLELVLIINRGIKGTPKYILDPDEVQAQAPPKKSSGAVEVEAKKVDEVKARVRSNR